MNIDQLLQATPARLSILNRASAPTGAPTVGSGSYASAVPAPHASYPNFQQQQMQTRSFQSNVMPQAMPYHQSQYAHPSYPQQMVSYPGTSYDLAEPQIVQPPRPMAQVQHPPPRSTHSYYPQPAPLPPRIHPAQPAAVNYSLLSPGTQSIAQQWNIPAAAAGPGPQGFISQPHPSAAKSFYTSAASSIHPTQPHSSYAARTIDMDDSLNLSIDTPSPVAVAAATQPMSDIPRQTVATALPAVAMTLEEQNAHLQQQRQRLRELTAAAGIAPDPRTIPAAANYAAAAPLRSSFQQQTIPLMSQPHAASSSIYLHPEDDPDEDVSVSSDEDGTKSKSASRSPSRSPRTKSSKSKIVSSPKNKEGVKIRSELSRIYELLGQNDSFYSTVAGSQSSSKKKKPLSQHSKEQQQPQEVKEAKVIVEDEDSEEEGEEKEQDPEVHVHVHVHPSPKRGRPRTREPVGSTSAATAPPTLKKSVSFHEQGAQVQAQVLEETLQATMKRIPVAAPASDSPELISTTLPSQSLPMSPPISLDDLSDSVTVSHPQTTMKSGEKENQKPAAASVRGSVMKIASAPLRASVEENRSANVRNLAHDTATKKSSSNKKAATAESQSSSADVASSLRTLKSRRVKAPAPFEPSASYRRPGPGGAAGSAPSAQNAESKVSEKALPSDVGVFMPTGSFHASSTNKLAHSSMKHASDKPRITGHEATVLARLAQTARVPRPIQCAISLYGETITQEQLNEMTKGDEKPKKPERSPSPPTHPPRTSPLVLRGPISKRIGTYSPQKALMTSQDQQAIEPRSPLGAREPIPETEDDEKYPTSTTTSSRPPMLTITAGSSTASSAQNSPKMISVAGVAAAAAAQQQALLRAPQRSPSVVEVTDETEADRIEAEAIERNKAGLEALFAQMSQHAGLDGFSLEHRMKDAGTTPSVPRVASFSLDKPLRPSQHARSRSASPAFVPRLRSGTTSADFSPRSRPRSESASPLHRPLLRRAQSMQIGGSEPTSPVLYHWPSSPVMRHQRSLSVGGNSRPSLSRSSSTSSINGAKRQKSLATVTSGRTSRSSSLTSSPLHSARSTQSARPLPSAVSVGSPTLRRSASMNVTSSRSDWLPQPDKQTLTPRSPDGAAEARRERIRARSLSLEQYGLERSPDKPSLSRLPSRVPSMANSRQPSFIFPTVPTPRGSGNLSSRSLAPSQAEQARSATGSLAHTRSSSLAPSPVLDPIVEPESSRPGSALGLSPTNATSANSSASPVPPQPNEAVKSFLQNLLAVTGTLQQDPKTRDLANQLLLASLAPGSILRTAAASASATPSVVPPIIPPLHFPTQSPISSSDLTSSDSTPMSQEFSQRSPLQMYRAPSQQGATVAAGGSASVPSAAAGNAETPNSISPLNPLNLPPPMQFDNSILRPNRGEASAVVSHRSKQPPSMPYGPNFELFNFRGQTEAKALIEGRHVDGSNKRGSAPGPSGSRGPQTLSARLASLKPIVFRKKVVQASPTNGGKKVPPPILLPTARSLMKYRLHILARIRSELARHELLHVEQVKLLKGALDELVARRKDVEAEAREEILYQSYLSLTKRHEERRRMKAELTGEMPDPDDPDAETLVQEALVRELSRLSPTNPLLVEQVEAHPAVQQLHQQRRSINLQLVWIGWTHAHARKRLRQALIEAARDGYDAFERRANATLWRVIACRGQRDLIEQAASSFTKQEAQQFAFEPYENLLASMASVTRKPIPTFEDAQSHLEQVHRVQAVRKWKSLSRNGHSMHEHLSQFLTKRYSRGLYAFWSAWRVKILRIYKERIQTQMAFVYAELMHEARSFRSWRMNASRDAFLLHQVAVAAEQLKLQQVYDAQLQMFHQQQQQQQQFLLMSASANNSFSLDQTLNQSLNNTTASRSKAAPRSNKSFMRDTVSTMEKRSRPTPATGKRKPEPESVAKKKPLEPVLNTSSASAVMLPPQPSPPAPPTFIPPSAPTLAQYYAHSISPVNISHENWVHHYAHLLRSNVLNAYREQLSWIEAQLSLRANAQAPIGWIIDRFVTWSLDREEEERRAIERVRRERERVQQFKEYMGAGSQNRNLLPSPPAEELNASTASTSAFSPAASARAPSPSTTTPRSMPYSYSATSSPERGPINNRQKNATVSFSSPASPVKDSMQSRQQRLLTRLLEAPHDSVEQVDEASQTQSYVNELVNEEVNRSIEEQHANLEMDFLRSHMPLSVPVSVALPGDESLLNHTTSNLGAVPEGFIRDSEEDDANSELAAKKTVAEWLKQFDLPNPEEEEVRMLDEQGRAIIRSPLKSHMQSPLVTKHLKQSAATSSEASGVDATNEISFHADGSVDTSRLDMSQGNEHHVHVHHFPPELNRAIAAAEQETIQRQQRQIEQLEQENHQLLLQQTVMVEQTQHEIEQQQEMAQLQLKKELLAQFTAYADHREAEMKQQWELEQDHELQLQEDINRANAKKQQHQRMASPAAARAKHAQAVINREDERQRMVANEHWAYMTYRKVFSSWMARTQLAHLERLATQQRLQREEEEHNRAVQKQMVIERGNAAAAASASFSNNAASDPELSAALELSQIPSRDTRRTVDYSTSNLQTSSALSRSGLRMRTPAEEGVLRPVYPELVDERRAQEQLSQSIHQIDHTHRNHALDDGGGEDAAPIAYEASTEVRTMSAALDEAMFKRFAVATDRRTQLNLETAILKVPVKSNVPHQLDSSSEVPIEKPQRSSDTSSANRGETSETVVPSSHILSPTDLRELLLIAAASIEPNATKSTDAASTVAATPAALAPLRPPVTASAASRFEPSIVHRPSSTIASFTDLSFTPSTSFGTGGFQNKPGNMWLNSLDVSAVEHVAPSNDQSLLVVPAAAATSSTNGTDHRTSAATNGTAAISAEANPPISSLLVDPLRPPARPLPRLSFNFAALKRKV